MRLNEYEDLYAEAHGAKGVAVALTMTAPDGTVTTLDVPAAVVTLRTVLPPHDLTDPSVALGPDVLEVRVVTLETVTLTQRQREER